MGSDRGPTPFWFSPLRSDPATGPVDNPHQLPHHWVGLSGANYKMSFFAELKRRNVFRVGAAYVIVAWVILQVSDVVLSNIEAPGWVFRAILLLLVIGLPVILIFAWAFELTPEGIKRETQVDPSATITAQTGAKLNVVITAGLIIAVAYIAIDKLYLSKDGDETTTVTEQSAAAQSEKATTEKSIAVLPFSNRSANNENAEFFASGIQDELLTLLSRLGDLKVISRTSVESLDPNLSIPKIGTLLGVATILEGQVQRAGDKVRINVQLIDAAKEDHLWANIYDRELTADSVFQVQSEIATAITEALHVQLSASDEALIHAVPTQNTEALNLYMLGQDQLSRGSFESYRKAANYFKEATTLDPQYAQAWVAIATAANRLQITGSIDQAEYESMAEGPITTALKLNDRLPGAYAELGTLKWLTGDFAAAGAAFEKALQLNPRDGLSLLSYGRFLRSTNRPLQALPYLQTALETDPLSPELLFELGKVEMYSGHADKAVAYGKQILEMNPTLVNGTTILLQGYYAMGRYDLAWPAFVKGIAMDPGDYENWSHAGLLVDALGDRELADRYIGRALALGPGKPAVLKCQAQLLTLHGQSAEAIAIARDALEARLDGRWGSTSIFLRLVRDEALRTGNYDDAVRWYRERHPELFSKSPTINDTSIPTVNIGNVQDAIDLALLLRRSGDAQTADWLLDEALEFYRNTGPDVVHGSIQTLIDVELFAMRGDPKAALDAFSQAIDGGWYADWQLTLTSPNLDSIRNDPEFNVLVDKLKAKMATQLNIVKALPYQGEADLR